MSAHSPDKRRTAIKPHGPADELISKRLDEPNRTGVRRTSVRLNEVIPCTRFKELLNKLPPSSYQEVDSRETPIQKNVTSEEQDGENGHTIDLFLNDFFFLRNDLKEGQYLMYIYVPCMNRDLSTKVDRIHQTSTMTANGLEHMSFVGEGEYAFQNNRQAITNENAKDIIRIAFKMKDGRVDPKCRAAFEEFPIMTLPPNDWPLIRVILLSAQPVKHDCFMKKGNLSEQEINFLSQGYPPQASAMWYLDRGETARTSLLAAYSGGQIRLSTVKVQTNKRTNAKEPSKRCVVNGRITFRLAFNNAGNFRRLMPSSNEIDRMSYHALKDRGIEYDFLEDVYEKHNALRTRQVYSGMNESPKRELTASSKRQSQSKISVI
eukprot:GHVH01016752.1.p1 GENE.GHVH01016752.1~~GHVH01016752.1.p1  ORF type:complete len:377 (-),score=69.87 GHVH01016752.1:1133-2263(-)